MNELWRTAAKDRQHPLHRATMLLFTENFNPKVVAKLLAPQKAEVIDYLRLILNHEPLLHVESFGGGFGPIHAVELVGEWKLVEFVPLFLEILEKTEWGDIVLDKINFALVAMGEEVLRTLLEIDNPVIKSRVAVAVSEIAPGSEIAYHWATLGLYDERTDEHDLDSFAVALIAIDKERGLNDLEQFLKEKKLTKYIRDMLRDIMKDAREGKL